jgi:hypothetical protein
MLLRTQLIEPFFASNSLQTKESNPKLIEQYGGIILNTNQEDWNNCV